MAVVKTNYIGFDDTIVSTYFYWNTEPDFPCKAGVSSNPEELKK